MEAESVPTKRWYSLNRQWKVVDHAPVTVEQALEIAGEYFANADRKFESVDESVEATMFGFGSRNAFIEFGMVSSNHISCRFEVDKSSSWFARVFCGVHQHNAKLTSKGAMIERIREFYSLSPEELMKLYR